MKHTLKIAPAYFQAVISGSKTFEIRENDRDFNTDDTVVLREFDNDWGYTGKEHTARIGYVTGAFQKPGYVVFSLLPHTPI